MALSGASISAAVQAATRGSPGGNSVVAKTPNQTAAQKAQIAAARTAAQPPQWSPASDPIVGAGPAGTGLHLTQSGRYVDQTGLYAHGQTPNAQAAAAGNANRQPVQTDALGVVKSPAPGGSVGLLTSMLAAAPKAAAPKPVVQKAAPVRPVSPAAASTYTSTGAAGGALPATQGMPAASRTPAAATVTKQPAVAPQPAVRADPFKDPAAAYISSQVDSLGTPQTDAQIQSSATASLAPLVQSITDKLNAQAKSGTAAIGGYTSELAKQLSGYAASAGNIYGGAEQSQAASDAALSQRLAGGGSDLSQNLAASLAGINAPGAVGAAAGGIANVGTGSGNALYATGSASLADLIARGAAEQAYAAKLPGIAGFAGAQQVGGLESRLATSLADQLAQVQSQVPGMVTSLQNQRSDLLGRQATLRENLTQNAATNSKADKQLKAEAILMGGYDNTTGQLTPEARDALSKLYGMQIPGGSPKGTAATLTAAKQRQQGLAIQQQNSNTATAKALSDLYGVDANGNLTLAGRRVAAAEAKAQAAAKGGKVDTAKAAALRQLQTQAEHFYYGIPAVTNSAGVVTKPAVGPVLYPDAVARFLSTYGKAGVTLKDVTDILNTFYHPGEGGRPVPSQPAVHVKSKRGLGVQISTPGT